MCRTPNTPVVYLLFAIAIEGCAPASSPAPSRPAPCVGLSPDECAAKYSAELGACTAQAKTRAASEACEDDVREEYNRPPRSSAKDGGAP